MDEMMTAISTVGFPIVMVLILFKYMGTMNEQHREDVKDMTTAINNNSQILQKLTDLLTIGRDGK